MLREARSGHVTVRRSCGSVCSPNMFGRAGQELYVFNVGVCSRSLRAGAAVPGWGQREQSEFFCLWHKLLMQIRHSLSADSEPWGLSSAGDVCVWVSWVSLKVLFHVFQQVLVYSSSEQHLLCRVNDNDNSTYTNGAAKSCFSSSGSILVCKFWE